jgi:hypothetical protein
MPEGSIEAGLTGQPLELDRELGILDELPHRELAGRTGGLCA